MDIALPDLGENIEQAEVLNVLVAKGDQVAKDQPVLELETDKATFELPCPAAGTVSAIHVKKGDTLRVGQKILTLEAGAPAAEDKGQRRGKDEAPRAEPRNARAAADKPRRETPPPPDEPDGDETGPGRQDGRSREADIAGAAPPREPAPARARETRPAETRPAQRPGAPETRPAERTGEREEGGGADPDVAAGPAARRLAREHDVDLLRLRGTGSGGRITTEDVQAFVRGRAGAPPAARAETGSAPAGEEREDSAERQALSGIDKAAARHLSASWTEIPHVTHHDLADVTELEQARVRRASARKEDEPKLTWTALVVKAVVAALRAFPRFNSRLDAERDELVLARAIHVGIAVDTEHGLLVPVLRDAGGKTTRQIAAEIAALAERARARKLGREEMQGAGFTVTNLGGIGGVAFTPIVSRPQVAILGVARLREQLALREGRPVARIVLPLSLSYDHRVINGADAARFVRHLAGLLEDPVALLLES